jgi:YjbE family integral membrane protein
LAGDNAVVVGLAVAGLPAHQKRPAILVGIAGATVLRIALGAVTLQLLEIVGLMLAGGLLLLWVCWKMFRELRRGASEHHANAKPKTLAQAMLQIVIADLSMSLDNVLAVAGAAASAPPETQTPLLVIGLGLSIPLIVFGSTLLLQLMEKLPVLITLGAALLGWVAGEMAVADGGLQNLLATYAPALHDFHRLPETAGLIGAILVVAGGRLLRRRHPAMVEPGK